MQLPIEEYQHCLRTVAARFRTLTPKPVFQNGLMVPADKIRWALAPLKELENREALVGPPGPTGPETASMVRVRTQAARDTIAARRAEGKRGAVYDEAFGALKYPGEPGPLPAIELEPTGDEDDFGKVRVSVPAPVLDYDGEEMPAIPTAAIAKARKHPIAPLDIDNAVGSVGVQKTEKL